jgi:hypothetical protein
MTSELLLKTKPEFSGNGRAIFTDSEGIFYRTNHYQILESKDRGKTWHKKLSIPRSLNRKLIEPVRLLCRLLRHEVRAFVPLKNGGYVAATRSGLFYAKDGDHLMRQSRIEDSHPPPEYPMTISCDEFGRVIWGEYWYNADRREVRLYASEDYGQSFHIVHTFKAGETRHIHNILYDESLNKFWVFTGDYDSEPGIGVLEADFSNFEWLKRGEQRYRLVCAFNFGDNLLYGTDTELEKNGIYVMNKKSGKTELVSYLDGSSIYATRSGKYYVISTTAEPVMINSNRKLPKYSSLWISSDGYNWYQSAVYKKDLARFKWSYKYFQYGSLVLPRGENPHDTLMFSGQALKGIDGKVYTVQL